MTGRYGQDLDILSSATSSIPPEKWHWLFFKTQTLVAFTGCLVWKILIGTPGYCLFVHAAFRFTHLQYNAAPQGPGSSVYRSAVDYDKQRFGVVIELYIIH